jgi:hypothetical protein
MAFKDWPSWLKLLVIISFALLALIAVSSLIILIVIFITGIDRSGLGIMIAALLSIFITITGMWMLGFVSRYQIGVKRYAIANMIAIVGTVGFAAWLLHTIIFWIFTPYPQPFMPLIVSGLSLVLIYFILSLIFLNRAILKEPKLPGT